MRWLTFLALLLLMPPAFASVSVKVTMRDSGYTLGDTLQMQVEIPLAKEKIDMESLPMEGRVASWLDLRTLKVSEKSNKTLLDMTWQLFGTVEFSQPLKLPEIAIKTTGKNAQTIVIPAQTFYYSAVLAKTVENEKMRPNLPPLRFDEHTPKFMAVLLAILALCSGLALAWVQDKLPFLLFKPRPLTRLFRQLQSEGSQVLSVQRLQQIHHALNLVAGQSLYPNTLNQLFEVAPYLQNEQSSIRDFFALSWQEIYRGGESTISADSVKEWLRHAALAERIYSRAKR